MAAVKQWRWFMSSLGPSFGLRAWIASNDNGRFPVTGLTRKGRARLAESLRVLRALNELRGPATTEVRDQYERSLRDRLRDIDLGKDVRQLPLFAVVLVVALHVVGCGGDFVSFGVVHEAGAGGSELGAGGATGAGGITRTAGAPGAGGSTILGRGGSIATGGTQPQRTHDGGDAPDVTRDAGGPDGGVTDASDGAPSCVRYEGAVFICSPGESTWFPCPEPPRGCAFAQGTRVVCCP